MVTVEKAGIGVLGQIYTDDIEMTITTGENETLVLVNNGTIVVQDNTVPTTPITLQTGDLWDIWGQSNCGRSRVSEMSAAQQTAYAQPFTNVTMMNQYVSKTTYGNLDAGTNTMLVNPSFSDEFGFEVSFFKKINEIDSSKRYFVVKHGYGASSLAVQWFWSYDPLELFFQANINRITQAATNAQAEGITLKLRGVIQMQGEQDAADQTNSNNYFNNLCVFYGNFDVKIAGLIKSGLLHPDSINYRKIICKIKRFDGIYEDIVNQAFTDFASIHGAKLVETDDLALKDSIHFTATSQITLGERIYAKMFE